MSGYRERPLRRNNNPFQDDLNFRQDDESQRNLLFSQNRSSDNYSSYNHRQTDQQYDNTSVRRSHNGLVPLGDNFNSARNRWENYSPRNNSYHHHNNYSSHNDARYRENNTSHRNDNYQMFNSSSNNSSQQNSNRMGNFRTSGKKDASFVKEWLPYRKFKDSVYNFVPLKTPCDECWDHAIPAEERFRLEEFLEHQRTIENREIKLVVNLCYTDKFYRFDREKLRDLGYPDVEYMHFPTMGRSVPKWSDLSKLFRKFDQVLYPKNSDDNNYGNSDDDNNYIAGDPSSMLPRTRSHIAIHCTHGANRTAFYVLAYLLRQKCFADVQEAKNVFEERRGAEMKRAYLVEGLQKYLSEGKL